MTRLQDFEDEILNSVMLGFTTPKITDDFGNTPIVACLDSEPLYTLTDRVRACGGYATVYSLAENGSVRVLAVSDSACAIAAHPTDMVSEPPSETAPIGMFIDYVMMQKDGVTLPSVLHNSCVRSYGRAELVAA